MFEFIGNMLLLKKDRSIFTFVLAVLISVLNYESHVFLNRATSPTSLSLLLERLNSNVMPLFLSFCQKFSLVFILCLDAELIDFQKNHFQFCCLIMLKWENVFFFIFAHFICSMHVCACVWLDTHWALRLATLFPSLFVPASCIYISNEWMVQSNFIVQLDYKFRQ